MKCITKKISQLKYNPLLENFENFRQHNRISAFKNTTIRSRFSARIYAVSFRYLELSSFHILLRFEGCLCNLEFA